ncbi:hypothetical protein HanRHA438_Chr01g0018771 [Helianthus annuus]|nr:hypothetical protein HanRHA438_Chr01g0018771 [Helianthus annuus]
MREVASVRDSGLEKAVRSTSSYHGRRRVNARLVDSVRREMKARKAGVAEMAEDQALPPVDDGGSEIGRFWEDIGGNSGMN